jgi:hypothetical protein
MLLLVEVSVNSDQQTHQSIIHPTIHPSMQHPSIIQYIFIDNRQALSIPTVFAPEAVNDDDGNGEDEDPFVGRPVVAISLQKKES